jgi:hypothetical protein
MNDRPIERFDDVRVCKVLSGGLAAGMPTNDLADRLPGSFFHVITSLFVMITIVRRKMLPEE